MRNDIKLNGWKISSESHCKVDAFMESIFFTGNGRMGARGYTALRPEERPVETGLFVAGMFDEISPGITDFVNLPTPLWHTIELNGKALSLVSPIRRALDLHTGTLTICYQLEADDARLEVTEERIFLLARPDLLAQRLTIVPSNAGRLNIHSGIDNTCCNCPVPDDQVKENNEIAQLTRYLGSNDRKDGFEARYSTTRTQIRHQQIISYRVDAACPWEFYDNGASVGIRVDAQVRKGTQLALEKLVQVTTSRDIDPRIGAMPKTWSYDSLWESNRLAWAAKWEDCDIAIEGDDDTQTALRYAIYQLIINCSPRDDTVNIGARGLTHTRYKGCYFWDTDLFMMPFYLLTDPQAARSLMGYRVKTLPQAKAHAEKMNGAGARYPWMVSLDGTEQCESWDIGCSEVHVTADIAYAAGQYMDWAQDRAFFLCGGAELLVETARFWVSRYTPAPDGGVNLLFCKGPDEYCGITSNNLFTNMMVQHNLEMAEKAAFQLQKSAPEQLERLGVSKKEIAGWATLREAIPLPRDPVTGHYRTDDTFHLLESVDTQRLKSGDTASYHEVCFDRLQRYKVIKQADVLLLMTRLPGAFTHQEKLDAWADFEPLCLHDSTLSFASHALFAAQNGLMEKAEAYFQKALHLDLNNIMGNTGKEGLHLAGLGETWQTVLFGFAGLTFENGGPVLHPNLPRAWQRLGFRFSYQGARYAVDITNNAAKIKTI